MRKNKIFKIVIYSLMSIFLSSCTILDSIKVSQDKLPWFETGDTLLEEDFLDPSSGWEVVNNVYELKGYSPEGYLISINTKNGRSISTTGLKYSDIKVKTTVRKITGPTDSNYGIICRYIDQDNYYGISVGTDGYLAMIKVENGKTSILGEEQFKYSELVNQNDGLNELALVCVGDEIKGFINDVEFLSIKDNNFLSGDVGIFLETSNRGPASAVFEKILIIKN